jgi:hypothetical protein
MTATSNSSFVQRPASPLGWWAVGLLAVFLVMFLVNTFIFVPTSQAVSNPWWRQALLPFYGIFMMLCGLAAGITGLVAIIKKHERSWLVWLAILPGVFVLFLWLGEFLVPH